MENGVSGGGFLGGDLICEVEEGHYFVDVYFLVVVGVHFLEHFEDFFVCDV